MANALPRPKAIFVGVQQIRDIMAEKIKPEWDFSPAIPDIQSLWNGLENGEIDDESQVLVILDIFFDPTAEDMSFDNLIAMMAPACMVAIVSYKPQYREAIRERVGAAAYLQGESEPNYYFIDKSNPIPSMDAALADYIETSPLADVVSVLAGREVVREPEPVREMAPVKPAGYYDSLDEEEDDSPYLGQIVAVTSSKGGSGKSSTAITLATYIAHASANSVREGLEERPLKVAILDLDVRDGQLGFVTGNSKPTIIQLRFNGISQENIEATAIYSPRLKCDLFLAPKSPRRSEDTPPDFYVELLHNLRKMYDYVILDTSVNYLDPLLEKVAYPLADQIIFVTDIVVNSVFSMTRWIREVTKPKDEMGMGISKNKIGIVVNKSLSNVAMPGEKIAKSALGIPVITAIPSNPKIVAHAANVQSFEVLLQHQDIYVAIRRLARAIVGKKYQLSNNVDE